MSDQDAFRIVPRHVAERLLFVLALLFLIFWPYTVR